MTCKQQRPKLSDFPYTLSFLSLFSLFKKGTAAIWEVAAVSFCLLSLWKNTFSRLLRKKSNVWNVGILHKLSVAPLHQTPVPQQLWGTQPRAMNFFERNSRKKYGFYTKKMDAQR